MVNGVPQMSLGQKTLGPSAFPHIYTILGTVIQAKLPSSYWPLGVAETVYVEEWLCTYMEPYMDTQVQKLALRGKLLALRILPVSFIFLSYYSKWTARPWLGPPVLVCFVKGHISVFRNVSPTGTFPFLFEPVFSMSQGSLCACAPFTMVTVSL